MNNRHYHAQQTQPRRGQPASLVATLAIARRRYVAERHALLTAAAWHGTTTYTDGSGDRIHVSGSVAAGSLHAAAPGFRMDFAVVPCHSTHCLVDESR